MLALGAIAVLCGVLRIPAAGWILGRFDPLVAFSPQAKQVLADWEVPPRRMGRIQSSLGSNDSRVVVFGQNVGADIRGRPLYVGWYYAKLEDFVLSKVTPEDAAGALAVLNVTYVIFDHRRERPEWDPWETAVRHYGKLLASANGSDLYEFFPSAVPGKSLFPDDSDGWKGWAVLPPSETAPQGDTLVLPAGSAVSRAAEVVNVPPGTPVMLTAELRCAVPSKIRVQINWLRNDGSILRTDAKHAPCNEAASRGMIQVPRPEDVRHAYFYFTNDGHAEARLSDMHASVLVRTSAFVKP